MVFFHLTSKQKKDVFENFLESFKLKDEIYELYKAVFKDFIETMNSGKKANNIEKEIEKINARKEKLDIVFMDNKINADKYNVLLDRSEHDLLRLQVRKEH